MAGQPRACHARANERGQHYRPLAQRHRHCAGAGRLKLDTLDPVIVSVTVPKAEEEVVAAPVVAKPEKGKAAKPKKDEKENKK